VLIHAKKHLNESTVAVNTIADALGGKRDEQIQFLDDEPGIAFLNRRPTARLSYSRLDYRILSAAMVESRSHTLPIAPQHFVFVFRSGEIVAAIIEKRVLNQFKRFLW